jgi:Ras-related protein Rab-22
MAASRMTNHNKNQRPDDPDKDAQTVKVVLLGDSGVGKSSLALRFVTNEFKPYNEATIGASFMSKTVLVPSGVGVGSMNTTNTASEPITASSVSTTITAEEGTTTIITTEEESSPSPPPKRIAFKIWDTAGQEKYASLAPMYYRGAGAAVLTYDICKAQSFEVLKKWVQELQRNGPPNIVLAVCGNKFDLAPKYRQVDADVARQYAESIGAEFYEVR